VNALVFGAGNIGRGFLGLQLAQSGFAVTFVDVNDELVQSLADRNQYPVFVMSGKGTDEESVTGVTAIHANEKERVINAIVDADIILTAVGKHALQFVAPTLAEGLLARKARRPSEEIHVVVIACENVNENTQFLADLIFENLSDDDRKAIENLISFPNCVVDRIVPNTLPDGAEDHPLAVAVEDYFQFVADSTMLKAPLPNVQGFQTAVDLRAILEQKLFTLNMAHAIVGYYGYLRGHQFIHEAVDDNDIATLLSGALGEVGRLLSQRHDTISAEGQERYASSIVERFRNPHLRDEVVRVARDPRRKLGPEDRLLRPAVLLEQQEVMPVYLTTGIVAAFSYDYGSDQQAQKLVTDVQVQGIAAVIEDVCDLSLGQPLMDAVIAAYTLRSL